MTDPMTAQPPSPAQELRYPRLNPLLRRAWFDGGEWSAEYRTWSGREKWRTSGHETRAEALEHLRRFVGMKVAEVDGAFVEVPRKPRWWWPRTSSGRAEKPATHEG